MVDRDPIELKWRKEFDAMNSSLGLVRYDAARHALAEARSVDEMKDIKDRAEAIRAYGVQVNDTDMVSWASEIKLRAMR